MVMVIPVDYQSKTRSYCYDREPTISIGGGGDFVYLSLETSTYSVQVVDGKMGPNRISAQLELKQAKEIMEALRQAIEVVEKGHIESQTEFDLILTDLGPDRVGVMRLIREISGVNLTVVNNMIKDLPQIIKSAIGLDLCVELKRKFENLGATVEVK